MKFEIFLFFFKFYFQAVYVGLFQFSGSMDLNLKNYPLKIVQVSTYHIKIKTIAHTVSASCLLLFYNTYKTFSIELKWKKWKAQFTVSERFDWKAIFNE